MIWNRLEVRSIKSQMDEKMVEGLESKTPLTSLLQSSIARSSSTCLGSMASMFKKWWLYQVRQLKAPFGLESKVLYGEMIISSCLVFAGAHTIGVARCSSFKSRLSNFDSTHDTDPSMNSNFARVLSKTCAAGDNAEQPLDPSRNTFDNAYYIALQRQAGVLFSDQSLFTSARTRRIVNAYAMNQVMFAMDFQQAMLKMGLLDVKEGSTGEVRENCRKINWWILLFLPL